MLIWRNPENSGYFDAITARDAPIKLLHGRGESIFRRSSLFAENGPVYRVLSAFRPVFRVTHTIRTNQSAVFELSTGSIERTAWPTEPCFSSTHESALLGNQTGV